MSLIDAIERAMHAAGQVAAHDQIGTFYLALEREGLAVVPIEPDWRMRNAGASYFNTGAAGRVEADVARATWLAMLKAASGLYDAVRQTAVARDVSRDRRVLAPFSTGP